MFLSLNARIAEALHGLTIQGRRLRHANFHRGYQGMSWLESHDFKTLLPDLKFGMLHNSIQPLSSCIPSLARVWHRSTDLEVSHQKAHRSV